MEAAEGNPMDTEKLSQTFVELADSLVDEFDVFDLLHVLVERCVELLGVSAAGLLLADEQDRLRVAASSSERARLLDLYQLQSDQGPCLECYHTGRAIAVHALTAEDARWPRFAAAAVGAGFASVLALPLRLRGEVIGALNLFGDERGTPDADIIPVAQAMADVATIAILQARLSRQRDVLNEQLQTALDSRVAIEQAKGLLAARLDLDPAEAFEILRRRSRDTRRPLRDLAEEVVATRPDGDWEQYRRR
jgi:GAF domain-containing protein